jgi:peptidoglycan/xylan/chitin deacetylase (PgdA/CDA1 family)
MDDLSALCAVSFGREYAAIAVPTATSAATSGSQRHMPSITPGLARSGRGTNAARATTLIPVPDQLILCYHAVSDDWASPLAVTRRMLERQLGSLVKRGYRGVTFEQVVSGQCEHRAVAVTFDDAYRSTLTRAAPVLASFGLPGTVFVPTDYVERSEPMCWAGLDGWRDTPYAEELICLTWDELAALRDAGWEIGSHTRSHPRLSRLADGRLREELSESRRALVDRFGQCTSLALPYGDGDARVVAAATAAGYDAIAGLPRPGASGASGSPRVGVYRADGMLRFRLKVARATRRVGASALGRPLATVAARRGRR